MITSSKRVIDILCDCHSDATYLCPQVQPLSKLQFLIGWKKQLFSLLNQSQ